jgi:hypothetical protein
MTTVSPIPPTSTGRRQPLSPSPTPFSSPVSQPVRGTVASEQEEEEFKLDGLRTWPDLFQSITPSSGECGYLVLDKKQIHDLHSIRNHFYQLCRIKIASYPLFTIYQYIIAMIDYGSVYNALDYAWIRLMISDLDTLVGQLEKVVMNSKHVWIFLRQYPSIRILEELIRNLRD